MQNKNEEKTYAVFSSHANRKLIARLEEKGAEVFPISPPQINEINSVSNSTIVKDSLLDFDWIIFPDVLAVDYFLTILEENEIGLFELDEKRVLALGEAVADQLRFVQLHADVIPKTIDNETVFSELLNYLEEGELDGLNFLVPKEEKFNFELEQKLVGEKAKVIEMNVYTLEISEKNEIGKIKALLKGGAIDEMIVTNPRDVTFLKYLFAPESLSEIFSETIVSGTDEVTVTTLWENKVRPRHFRG